MTIDPCNTDVKHGFSRTVAKQYSVNAALVLRYISYRLNHSKNEFDGKFWYYDTIDNIAKHFPYLKRTAVYDALRSLTTKEGLLTTGNYNKKGYDRTMWYAFKNKAASEMAEKSVIHFKVQDACLLDVAKAVLLANLRYHINHMKETTSSYCLHPMSPTELADVLPYSRATIQRKLKDLVEADGELVSETDLDGRNPSKYGFIGEVAYSEELGGFVANTCKNANETTERLPQTRIGNIEGAKPDLYASTSNKEGANPDNYTTLIDNPLKETVGKNTIEKKSAGLRLGAFSTQFSSPESTSCKESSSFRDRSGNEFCEAIVDDIPKHPISASPDFVPGQFCVDSSQRSSLASPTPCPCSDQGLAPSSSSPQYYR
jgi:hypothetical protein